MARISGTPDASVSSFIKIQVHLIVIEALVDIEHRQTDRHMEYRQNHSSGPYAVNLWLQLKNSFDFL